MMEDTTTIFRLVTLISSIMGFINFHLAVIPQGTIYKHQTRMRFTILGSIHSLLIYVINYDFISKEGEVTAVLILTGVCIGGFFVALLQDKVY